MADWLRIKTLPEDRFALDRKSRYYQYWGKYSPFLRFIPSSQRYQITINHEKQFIWFRVPKVCSRSIYWHLKGHTTLDCDHPYNIFYPPEIYRHYFKFAFVRNPWDRFISCWNNKVIHSNLYQFDPSTHKKMQRLENFLDYVSTLDIENCDGHLRLQCKLIDLNHIDFIGRFENFYGDYQNVCQRLDIPIEDLGHRLKSDRKGYRSYFNDGLAEKVAAIYRKDIQIFSYQFE